MNLIKLFICLVIILFSTTVSAEFYKYVDENGNTHFTDDFNKVPKDQRAGLKGYEESDSDTDTIEKKAVKENEVQDDNKNQKDLEKFHDRLNNTRLQLVKEHEEIKKDREQTIEDRKNAKDQKDVWEINKKINELNEKQEVLKKKFEAFEAEKKEYNKKLEEAETKKK
jgi:chromosome segregation ATPase